MRCDGRKGDDRQAAGADQHQTADQPPGVAHVGDVAGRQPGAEVTIEQWIESPVNGGQNERRQEGKTAPGSWLKLEVPRAGLPKLREEQRGEDRNSYRSADDHAPG